MRGLHWARLVVAACAITVTTQAYAGLVCTTSHKAIIARPGKLSEMGDLIAAHEETQALLYCIACLVEPGTKVMITDQGFLSHTVRVLSGPSTGCEGDISADRVTGCDVPGGGH